MYRYIIRIFHKGNKNKIETLFFYDRNEFMDYVNGLDFTIYKKIVFESEENIFTIHSEKYLDDIKKALNTSNAHRINRIFI